MNEATQEEAVQTNGGFFDAAPSADVPIPPPEVHRGVITGVQFMENQNSEGGRIVVGLQSTDTGIETDYSFFPPLPFVNDIYAPLEAYSTEKPFYEESGREGLSEMDNYSRLISNKAGTAVLQELNAIAVAQGHTPATAQPSDITGLCAQLSTQLADVQVTFTRSADKNPRDPRFAGVLRVRSIKGPWDTLSKKARQYYTNPKNGYVLSFQM